MAAAAPLRLAVLGLCGLCLIAPLWIGGALHGFAVAVHLALALLCALTLSARPRPLPAGGRAFLLLLALPVALGILGIQGADADGAARDGGGAEEGRGSAPVAGQGEVHSA